MTEKILELEKSKKKIKCKFSTFFLFSSPSQTLRKAITCVLIYFSFTSCYY